MKKTILITGATDGIGLVTAQMLVEAGHHVLIHGRNPDKLAQVEASLNAISPKDKVISYRADLSILSEVKTLAEEILSNHPVLDAVINNAGIFGTANPITPDGLDARFAVNTVAPYLLTKMLLPALATDGRVVNLSSAAQSTLNPDAIGQMVTLSDNAAYAQSKLAITMWSYYMGDSLKPDGPVVVAVNPKSLLGSKMVKQAYGIAGSDLSVGADILIRAALSDEFSNAHGKYFDNDIGRFAPPHPDASNRQKCQAVVDVIETIIAKLN